MNLKKKLKQLCALPQRQRKAKDAVQTMQWFEAELEQMYRDLDNPKG